MVSTQNLFSRHISLGHIIHSVRVKWKWLCTTFLSLFVWGLRRMDLNMRRGTGIKDGKCKASQLQVQLQLQLRLFNLVLKLLSDGLHEFLKLLDVGFMQDLLRQVTLPFDLFFHRFRHIRYYVGQHEFWEINDVLRGEQNSIFRIFKTQTQKFVSWGNH